MTVFHLLVLQSEPRALAGQELDDPIVIGARSKRSRALGETIVDFAIMDSLLIGDS